MTPRWPLLLFFLLLLVATPLRAQEAPGDAPPIGTETESESESESETESESESETESESEPESETEPETEPEPESESESETEAEPDPDAFSSRWLGLRLGGWFAPGFDIDLRVGDEGPLARTLNGDDDLNLDEDAPRSDWLDFGEQGLVELEVYAETKWIIASAWLVPPASFQGTTTLTQRTQFGNVVFDSGTRVDVDLRQFFLGVDLALNLVDNRWLRLAPFASLRAIGVDWRMRVRADSPRGVVGRSGDTSASDLVSLGQFEVLPYPELGLDLRFGYRDVVELSLKAAAGAVGHLELEGQTLRFEGALTVYPIPYLGLQVGARFLSWEIDGEAEAEVNFLEFDLEMAGLTVALVARFG